MILKIIWFWVHNFVQKLTNFVKNIVAMGLNFISRFYETLKSLNEVTIIIMMLIMI